MSFRTEANRARALAGALCGLLLASPTVAAPQELPRHKPRVTDAVEDPANPGAAASEKRRPKKGRKSIAPAVAGEAPPAADPPRPPSAAPAGNGRSYRGAAELSSDEIPPGFTEIPVPREPAAPREAPREAPRRELEDDLRLSGIDEPGLGLGVEGLVGLLLLSGGISSSAHFGWGLAADWQAGRLFRPESYFYQNAFVELSWVHAGSSYGTEMVKVAQSQNHFAASALLGYTLGRAFFYGKLGPSLFLMPVTYEVQGTATDYLDAKLGLNLGLGVRYALYLNESLGIAVRLEVTGYRRGYLTDYFFTFGLGAAF